MESQPDPPPLVVIVGETASGKSALALDLAHRFAGEIIAADSRTVYRGMDIGTAKPTERERAAIPHHLLDVVDPDEQFTAADFKQLAMAAIHDISARHKLPFLVGGTGLYIDSILYDFNFGPKANLAQRNVLQGLSVQELQGLLLKDGIPLPQNERNPRHLIRAIETKGYLATRAALRSNTLIIGLQTDREVLRARIEERVEQMTKQGFVGELEYIVRDFGWDVPSLQSTGYRAFKPYVAGEVSFNEAKEIFVRNDLHLAKRQRTWFRRNKSIHWICKKEETVDLITTFLNNSYTANE